MAAAEGMRIGHVKPHGALSNMAYKDATLATHIARGQGLRCDADTACAGGVANEVFADRAYTDEGTLLPRGQPGAVLARSEDCVAHVLRMIDAAGIISKSGNRIATPFHSICVHGDNAHAVTVARAVRQALLDAGCLFSPLPQPAALRG